MIRGGRKPTDVEVIRIRVLITMMLAAFGFLAAFLYQAQVAHGARYQTDLDRQSIRRVRLPGMRGRIYDRNQTVLAENRPSYGIAVYLEEIRVLGGKGSTTEKVMELLGDLEAVIGYPPRVNEEEVRTHLQRRKPLPLIAWADLDEQAMARFAENASTTTGVDTWLEPVRVYPQGETGCHLLGYVGRTNKVQDAEQPYNFHYDEMLGRSGIEKHQDGTLRGRAGGRLLRVDVAGYRHEDIANQAPEQGSDIQLAIDLRAQALAEEALKGIEGSAVVIDPRNGDVLALASAPGFDPNAFVPYISSDTWSTMMNDPGHPLVNRAVAGTYAPGSVFKPVVAFAGLENDLITPEESYHCPGHFMLGRQRFNCWLHSGHGDMNTRAAVQHSCNVYFFNVGLKMGHQYIYHMAAALGLGEKTGISIDYERAGVLPNDRWKREHVGERWWDGDTCNLSIGQGALTVTPLQMALIAATIANRGDLYKPRLLMGTRTAGQETFQPIAPHIVNRLNWSARSLAVVRGGMYDSVMSPRGVGRLARVPGIEIGGKTGTAEYGPKALGKKRGWMIAFAPFHEPTYAVAVVVDDADGGGVDAGPRVQHILAGLFRVPMLPARGVGDG